MNRTEQSPWLFDSEIPKTGTQRRKALDRLNSLRKDSKAFREGVLIRGDLRKEGVDFIFNSLIKGAETYKQEAPDDLKQEFDEIIKSISADYKLSKNEPQDI